LATVQPGELWIGDRAMCTSGFLRGISSSGSHFVIPRHKSLSLTPVSERQYCGETWTGQLFEQMVRLNYPGEELLIRQVTIELFKPTRNGEKEVEVLTRLSTTEATTTVVAQLYIERRSVENLFQTFTKNYEGEIQTLGYPKQRYSLFLLH